MRLSSSSECLAVSAVSGGPDSVCSMVYWLSRGCDVAPLFFDYGQKAAKRELEALRRIVERLREIAGERKWGRVEEPTVLDLKPLGRLWVGSQLTDESVEVTEEYDVTVVVPIRNVIMAAVAAARAYALLSARRLERVLVILGSQRDDVRPREDTWEPRYPDCSPECLLALEASLKICHFRGERRIELWAPSAAGVGKSELLRSCYELIGDLIYETWSCYRGLEKHCGSCESCANRRRALREAGLPDKTEYMS